MKRIETRPMKAEITLGYNQLYSGKKDSLQDVILEYTEAQQRLNAETGTRLSAKVTPCRIVFSGQDEESVTISFINYPRFPVEVDVFEQGVEYLARELMHSLIQNRTIIECPNKTVMLEKSDTIDPAIM